jgi:HSP20 family protein
MLGLGGGRLLVIAGILLAALMVTGYVALTVLLFLPLLGLRMMLPRSNDVLTLDRRGGRHALRMSSANGGGTGVKSWRLEALPEAAWRAAIRSYLLLVKEPANSAGGEVSKMDVLIDSRLSSGRRLVDGVNGLYNGLASELQPISPPVDVAEDQNGYRFSIELPGLKSDSLEVKVDDGSLVINAERAEPAWGKDARVHRAERHYGPIRRAFRLPNDVGHEAIKAAYKDGVLEVTIAKVPEAKAVKVEVVYIN